MPHGYFKTLARRRQRLLQLLEQPLVRGIVAEPLLATADSVSISGPTRPIWWLRLTWSDLPTCNCRIVHFDSHIFRLALCALLLRSKLGCSILAGSLALPLVWAEPVFLAETSAGATAKIPIATEAIPKMRIMVSPQCRASACRDRSYAIPCR